MKLQWSVKKENEKINKSMKKKRKVFKITHLLFLSTANTASTANTGENPDVVPSCFSQISKDTLPKHRSPFQHVIWIVKDDVTNTCKHITPTNVLL